MKNKNSLNAYSIPGYKKVSNPTPLRRNILGLIIQFMVTTYLIIRPKQKISMSKIMIDADKKTHKAPYLSIDDDLGWC